MVYFHFVEAISIFLWHTNFFKLYSIFEHSAFLIDYFFLSFFYLNLCLYLENFVILKTQCTKIKVLN
jgi:hypothetical protein